MDSDDFSLIDIVHEDDSLLRNLPPDDAGHFACSPLVVAGSACSSRPHKTTFLKDKAHFGEIDATLPDNNKENLNESSNMKPGSSNLSMDPQKMKRNRKPGGYNLRKSLAWDKAFFTEEGVLSSSELSMICGTPIKLDGKHLPAIYEEQKTPMHANTNSFRKLHFSSTKDKRTIEGSILKQKSLASGSSLTAKKLSSAASAKNSGRKEGSSLRNHTPTSTNKRLLSPAKPLSHISKIPRVPVFKPDAHSTASSSETSHVKRNRIAPPVPSAQKQLGQKGCYNTRSTSNGAKIVCQRIPKPSKSSDQRTRKSRTVPCSGEQSSSENKVSNVKAITSSEDNSGKVSFVGLKPNTGNSCSIEQSIQHQVAKPSGLRMPSPSLRFFSEPKVSNPIISVGERNNSIESKIPKATIFGVIQSKTLNISKNHDELVHVKKDDLIVQDLLDEEKSLEQVNNKCIEEVGKYVMEHEHNILCSEGVDKANEGQNDLPAVHSPTGRRTDGCNEVEELQYPSHVTDDIFQVQDGLSSNIKDLLPERTFESDAIDSNAFRNVSDEDKVNLSASLDTEPQVEENVDLSVADETDLTGQNVDLEFHKSPRACKSTSQVDSVLCNVELSLSQAQVLGSTDAKSTTLETDQHHTELIDDNNMEMLVNANQNDNQSANSFPLKASKECNNGVNEVETDYQMNQEPPNSYLKEQKAENHTVLNYESASENDNTSDPAIIQEPQWSSRINGDCTITSSVNCDILVSTSPCIDESTNVTEVETANHDEDIHDIDNEDEKASLMLKDGKIQSQLVIRPPENVAPFSDEWLAAVEAAGEDILTLKTGPVQNSPPSKLSPEPSPWSPVKRKNNQGIGPYDCTKYSTGQH